MRDSIRQGLLCAALVCLLAVCILPLEARAESASAYKRKDVYETERVKVKDIAILSEEDGSAVMAPVRFRVYNSTRQENEGYIESKGGALTGLELVKNHNYIFFAEDPAYTMGNRYIWIKGSDPIEIKDGSGKDTVVAAFYVKKRETPLSGTVSAARVPVRLNLRYRDPVNGTPLPGVKIRLVSALDDPITLTSDSEGAVSAQLLEDIVYLPVSEDGRYVVEPLPITVKNKDYGTLTYDHTNCDYIDSLCLTDPKDAHKNDTTLTSESKATTVTGMRFNRLRLLEKRVDRKIAALAGKDYEVYDIRLVNTFRWEVSKLPAGEYRITEKVDETRQVDHVYYIDDQDQLHEIGFEQGDAGVAFTMNSMSMYPVVLEYNPARRPVKVKGISVSGISKKIAAGKSIRLTAEITPAHASDKVVMWSSSNKKYASVNSAGKVRAKKAGAGKTVTITAAAADGSGVKAQYRIRIMKSAVKSIKLSAKKSVKAGKKLSVKAKVKTTGKGANQALRWTVSNESFASVNKKGVVRTKKAGKGKTVTVTAASTDGSNKKKSIKIRIR